MTAETAVQYETRSVKTIRGLETRTRAKLEKEGWEFVSQTQGTVRSELNFRRPKPNIPWKLIGIGGGVVALLLILLLSINALGGGDNASDSAATSPSPSQIATTEASAPSAEPTPAEPTPAAAPLVTDITVDELLDALNSAAMGGIRVGDQFRLTGELFMSDLWYTGLTGDFTVMLKAQGGAQDLSVFVDESDAAGWQDGTQVEMIVEMVEATINGDTTDGWLEAQTVRTIP